MLRTLRVLLTVGILISVVHYTDNFFNYDDFPDPGDTPAPSKGLVGASWFVFTAFGLAGYALLARGRTAAAAVCVALYSGSGLVGLGHYTVAGATDMVWWRQLHVVADILCGIALLAFAVRLARTRETSISAA